MSVKSLEGYTVVECDEIEGSNDVSYLGDDFTVETALEDRPQVWIHCQKKKKKSNKVVSTYIIPFLY